MCICAAALTAVWRVSCESCTFEINMDQMTTDDYLVSRQIDSAFACHFWIISIFCSTSRSLKQKNIRILQHLWKPKQGREITEKRNCLQDSVEDKRTYRYKTLRYWLQNEPVFSHGQHFLIYQFKWAGFTLEWHQLQCYCSIKVEIDTTLFTGQFQLPSGGSEGTPWPASSQLQSFWAQIKQFCASCVIHLVEQRTQIAWT